MMSDVFSIRSFTYGSAPVSQSDMQRHFTLHLCRLVVQVIEQNGAYYCEYDGKTSQTMRRRYVMQAKAMDFAGEGYVSVFNDQVTSSTEKCRLGSC